MGEGPGLQFVKEIGLSMVLIEKREGLYHHYWGWCLAPDKFRRDFGGQNCLL